MIYLFTSIILNALIFTLFKLFGERNINTFQAIVVNYFVCVITGSLYAGTNNVLNQPPDAVWIYVALGLGCVFVATFYFMALTAQRISMAASSIASKMSLIIPVVFSIVILRIEANFTLLNYLGVALALVATWMSTQSSGRKDFTSKALWLLPLVVFIGNGTIDATINYSNFKLLTPSTLPIFPIYAFLSAAVVGGIILLFGKKRLSSKAVIAGIILGIINYFSVYTILNALEHLNNNGALVFPIFNTGIILGSTAIGLVFFHEHLSFVNKAGIVLAFLSILLVVS